MPDDSTPSGPSRALTVAEMAHLRSLGNVYHAAPGYLAKQEALDSALRTAQRHKLSGAAWTLIVSALGIPDEELQHRLYEVTQKPYYQPKQPGRSPSDAFDVPNTSRPQSQAQYLLGSISTSQTHDAAISATLPSYSAIGSALSAVGNARRILFVSGDPHPGRNDFGSEAACVRQAVNGAFIDVTEKGSITLPEICTALENHAPSVLHIAAHSSFGGIHLFQDNSRLCVEYAALCAQIARVSFPPRLAVLSICHSMALANELLLSIPTVISWPHAITDDQAQTFALQMYRSLAVRRSVDASCKDAEAALAGPHPDCPPPTLHGDTSLQPF